MSDVRRYALGTDKLQVTAGPDGVGRITFNNPAKHNALSLEMMEALTDGLARLQADDAVRVVVAAGAGDKAFVSGADISEFAERRTSADARAEYSEIAGAMFRGWAAFEMPVIALIRGYCIGGGLLTACQADIRVATPDSRFAVPAARLGLGYEFGAAAQLVSLVGPSWASEILLTARQLGADEALACGLVNRVVAADEIDGAVDQLATSIAGNAPLTVRAAKAAIREAQRSAPERDVARVNALIEACFQSGDYEEGQRAFADKRAPVFRGR